MAFPTTAAITAGGGILNTVASQLFNRSNYRMQRRHALEDEARQNEYNSPKAQMARLKEAGLSPWLVYGSGGVQQQSATADNPNMTAPQVDLGIQDIPRNLLAAAQAKQTNLQQDLTAQAIENAKIDAQQKLANIIKTYLDIDTKNLDLKTKTAIQNNTILSADLQNQFLSAKIASEKPTAVLRGQQVAQNNLMMPLQVQKAQADIKRANAEILQTYSQIAKTEQDTKNAKEVFNQLELKTYQDKFSVEDRIMLTKKMSQAMSMDVKRKEYENAIKEIEAKLAQAGLLPKEVAQVLSVLKQIREVFFDIKIK